MMTGSNASRWYDKDPVISKALEELRYASSVYQAQIALNILKIIVEHRMEGDLAEPAEASAQHSNIVVQDKPIQRRRWYDTDQTLSSALALLQECPPDLQASIIPRIAEMIRISVQSSLV